jgi:hypothetical protein
MVPRSWQSVKNLQNYMGTSKASKIAQRMARDATILGIAEPAELDQDLNLIWKTEWNIKFLVLTSLQVELMHLSQLRDLTGRDLALATS